MNPPFPPTVPPAVPPTAARYQAVLQSALQRIKQASRLASERSVDSLGLAALSASNMRDRDDLLSAQFELNKRQAQFIAAFADTLDRRFARATTSRADAAAAAAAAATSGKAAWESFSLVEDREVEAQVMADRFSLAILHESEWELRELDAYMGSMLRLDRPDHERNPLRPESVGMALVVGTEAVSDRTEIRKILTLEIGRALTSLMRTAYADIVNDLRSAGVQPLSLTLRTTSGGRGTPGSTRSGEDAGDSIGLGPESASGALSASGAASRSGAHSTRSGSPSDSSRGGQYPGAQQGRGGRGGQLASFGQVDAQLMTLIRRLAFLGNAEGPATGGDGYGQGSGMPGGYATTDFNGGQHGHASGQPSGFASAPQPLHNLITAHRDELRQASTGALDHMVIDVVGSLFDQILSDPKVPPQMARQIARLQLPVLRVALGDVTFFSSRRHPVRRFVNRIASLACAFDDFAAGPGQQFIGMVKDLVEEIVTGDFDQMDVYDQKLASLEHFIADQTQAEVLAQGNAAELLEQKESDLLQQQRYMQQLQASLTVVEMHDFLRDFLSQVWSQAIVAAQRSPDGGARADSLRRAGRDLVMSVQPKGSPTERKAFLMQLPKLMKDLNAGLTMIGWPESAKKKFFAQLLPAHAESLKGQSMRQLDYNLLVKQLDAILGAPLPKPGELPPSGVLPVLDQVVPDLQFTPEEALRVGLVAESSVDWSGKVDIDLSAEPALSEVDINIDGLPPAEPTEPTSGVSLADHVQLGFAYQMHLDGQWQKVRMSYVSPGRAFFVFTRGRKHQKTVSLTHRMLVRMCESGRMRAFENAYLIERATARARRQLAELGGSSHSAPQMRQ